MAVCTYGDFIVLPHWEIKLVAPWPNWVTLSWHWAHQSPPYPTNAERQVRKRQVSILKSLVWLLICTWGSHSTMCTHLVSNHAVLFAAAGNHFGDALPPVWCRSGEGAQRLFQLLLLISHPWSRVCSHLIHLLFGRAWRRRSRTDRDRQITQIDR